VSAGADGSNFEGRSPVGSTSSYAAKFCWNDATDPRLYKQKRTFKATLQQ